MTTSSLLHKPLFVRFAIRVDRAPAITWLALVAASLAPTWWWMGQRMADGSDDPLGLLALLTLAWLTWRCKGRLRASPRLGWLAAALLLALLSNATHGAWPALLSALLGLLAMGAALAAFLPQSAATAPVMGLAVLSLPLLASLQFYAGFPLRVVTAEAGRWLLQPFFAVERFGTALWVDGRLVIVDAPCSGVQMLWLGYFTACVVALHAAQRNAAFLARLPAVSAIVLAGNVVRNAVLVALEGSGTHLANWAHEGVGLVVLGVVCLGIAAVMNRRERGDV
ncbi:MAG: exosortase Q [Burkholderiales bacterium]|nr:exosortase Q [Burkholderiales bacterium]